MACQQVMVQGGSFSELRPVATILTAGKNMYDQIEETRVIGGPLRMVRMISNPILQPVVERIISPGAEATKQIASWAVSFLPFIGPMALPATPARRTPTESPEVATPDGPLPSFPSPDAHSTYPPLLQTPPPRLYIAPEVSNHMAIPPATPSSHTQMITQTIQMQTSVPRMQQLCKALELCVAGVLDNVPLHDRMLENARERDATYSPDVVNLVNDTIKYSGAGIVAGGIYDFVLELLQCARPVVCSAWCSFEEYVGYDRFRKTTRSDSGLVEITLDSVYILLDTIDGLRALIRIGELYQGEASISVQAYTESRVSP